MPFRTLDNLDVAGKRVLLRADLNVPVRDGKITDLTRIERLSPTIRELVRQGRQGHRVQPFRPAQGQARAGDVARADGRGARRGAGPARALRRGLRRPVAAAGGRNDGPRRRAGAGEHPLPRRGRKERPRLRRRSGEARRHLRQRRVLRGASRACQHRGRGASAARLCRPPDAGRAGGAGRRAGQSRSARSRRSSAAPRSPPSWNCSATWWPRWTCW